MGNKHPWHLKSSQQQRSMHKTGGIIFYFLWLRMRRDVLLCAVAKKPQQSSEGLWCINAAVSSSTVSTCPCALWFMWLVTPPAPNSCSPARPLEGDVVHRNNWAKILTSYFYAIKSNYSPSPHPWCTLSSGFSETIYSVIICCSQTLVDVIQTGQCVPVSPQPGCVCI